MYGVVLYVCTNMFVVVVLIFYLPPHLPSPPSPQGMARMCCDPRRNVRHMAISYLQRALLAHDLQRLSPNEWEACFLEVSGTYWGGCVWCIGGRRGAVGGPLEQGLPVLCLVAVQL